MGHRAGELRDFLRSMGTEDPVGGHFSVHQPANFNAAEGVLRKHLGPMLGGYSYCRDAPKPGYKVPSNYYIGTSPK